LNTQVLDTFQTFFVFLIKIFQELTISVRIALLNKPLKDYFGFYSQSSGIVVCTKCLIIIKHLNSLFYSNT